MKLNFAVDRPTLLYRYIPCLSILLIMLYVLYWSFLVSNFGNNCESSDQSHYLTTQHQDHTTQLVSDLLVNIQKKRYKEIEPKFDQSLLKDDSLTEGLDSINKLIPEGDIKTITTVGINYEVLTTENYTVEKVSTINEVIYQKSEIVVEMLHYKVGDTIKVLGFRVYPKQEIKDFFKAGFTNATLSAYITIFFSVFTLILIVTALILCINNDNLSRKWLWIIFVILGFVGFDFNWTTQTFQYSLLSFRIFGVGWFKAGCYSPLILSFSIPVGAIFYLYKYRYLK